MNILYYFAEDNSYMTQWQRVHIFNELSKNGINITVFNPLKYINIIEANEKLIAYIKKNSNSIDMFMNCMSDTYIFKETIQLIKKNGIPTLLICFDNLHAPYMHKKIASSFDLVWLTSKETTKIFERWGCNNIVFQPYAANPHLFSPKWNAPIYSVGFIGTPYGSRANKINLLTKKKLSCSVYSNYGKEDNKSKIRSSSHSKNYLTMFNNSIELLSFSIGRKVISGALKNKLLHNNEQKLIETKYLSLFPSVEFNKMNYLYSNLALSLNITELRNTYVLKKPIHKLHLRTFEIPMSGGLEIVSYNKELSDYFEDGKEIVFYKTSEEMIDKARFYLNPENSLVVRNLKANARYKAENEHTWSKRFFKVFNRLDLKQFNY